MSHVPAPKNPKANDVHRASEPKPPVVVDEAKWLEERKALLAAEKDVSRAYDAMVALRRKLPWHPVPKAASVYKFEDVKDGKVYSLAELVGESGKPLVLQHFMFMGDKSDGGCSMCSLWTDGISGFFPQLSEKANFVVAANAQSLDALREFVARKQWKVRVVRCTSYEFGEDFHVSRKPEVADQPMVYNFTEGGDGPFRGMTELPGFTVFNKVDDQVCRSYSCYARGLEDLCGFWRVLDILPGGRSGYFPRHREEIEANQK